MANNVSFKELAKQLKIDPTTVRRLIERYGPQLGITVQKGRGDTINAKWTHFLSRDDANRLISFYETKHQSVNPNESESTTLQPYGVFYVIQLVPEALPNRIKIGYADSLEKRLADHHTAAPTAKVLGSWPCKRSWDYTAMDCITREGCVWVSNEVFEGDPDGFLKRANEFFAIMPKPDGTLPLSQHSPLKPKV